MFGTVKSFRRIGYLEGSSFLILLGIAMPLKYLADFPMAVRIVGWVHGVFFIFYVMEAFSLAEVLQWKRKRLMLALIAAVLPFGPFVFDRRFLRVK